MMGRHIEITLPPEEMASRRAYEETTPAQRLAALEAADPSQQRPKKVPCVWDRVDFMAWDTWRDLGVWPMQKRYLQ